MFLIKKVISLYLMGTGSAIILIWIIFFATNFTAKLGMSALTLTSHVIAEIIAGILAIIGGIMLINNSKYSNSFSFLGEGALLYAIVNILGYYWSIELFWLVGLLIVTLIAHIVIILFSIKILTRAP